MPSRTYRAHDFMEAAGKLGVEIVVGTDRRQALFDATRERVLALDFLDASATVREIASAHRSRPFAALLGVDDDTVLLAALGSEAVGLPTNRPAALRIARSKRLLRERLRGAGLPGPEFRIVPIETDPRAAAGGTAYPCVLKPTFLSASRGVIRADDPAAFIAAFERIRRLLADPELAARGGEEAQVILVESFLPGREVALEGLLVGGRLRTLALFDKPEPLDGPCFAETLYVTPSRLPAVVQKRVCEAVQQAADAIGLREGPLHAEVRAPEGACVVLECAARSIGGLCSRTLRFGAGWSLEEVLLRHALGLEVDPPEREAAAAAVLMLPIPRAGVLREVQGLAAAAAVPGVEGIEITVPLAQQLTPLPEGDRYLGFAFARATTPEAAEAALRRARDLLTFAID
jgi:biotin carboxylase